MKLLKTFLISFVSIALLTLFLDFNLLSFSELVTKWLSSFLAKKVSGDHYPVTVFVLLLISAVVELLLLFKINLKWLEKVRESAQKRLVNIGGALLGALTSLIGLAFVRGNIDETKLGINVALVVTLYIAAPLLMASVLYMLREPDPDPNRMLLIKRVAASTYIAIALISVWGIFKTALV